MITVHVPAMTARHDVRAVSDVLGVQTLQADLATRTVQVTGSAGHRRGHRRRLHRRGLHRRAGHRPFHVLDRAIR